MDTDGTKLKSLMDENPLEKSPKDAKKQLPPPPRKYQ